MKEYILKNKKELILALVLFAGITIYIFRPLFGGKELYQGDVERHRGMSKEIRDFREKYGTEPLWTNSMFSGMPAYQISTIHKGTLLSWLDKYFFKAFLPHPSGYVFLYFLGFFILMLCLRVSPLLAIFGSVAYGLGSYFIIILEAGHNSKANALGYLPAMLGGIILLFQGNYKWGFLLTSFFTAMELFANHVQITYYGYMIIGFLLLHFLWQSFKNKSVKPFVWSFGLFILATILGILPNAGNLWCTYEYGKWSTRGKSELTINESGKKDEVNKTAGLDKNYATQWSYGIDETFTFIIPDYKGGASMPVSRSYPDALKKVDPEFREQVGMMPSYFGPQPFTSGPVYLGVLLVILAVTGLMLSKNPLKYPLLAATVLAILLSWGKHFPLLTNFFLDYVPGYNKFRAVSMILIIPQLTLPVFAVWGVMEMAQADFLKRIIQWRNKHFSSLRVALFPSIVIGTFILSVALIPSLWQRFSAPGEEEQLVREFVSQGYPEDQVKVVIARLLPELEKARMEIVKSDAGRSLFYAIVCLVFLWFFLKRQLLFTWFSAGIISVSIMDYLTLNHRYLNKDSFVPKGEMERRLENISEADRRILSDSSLHKRVLNLTLSTFNDASTSYYHQSVGGYHGAKLKKYQELIDFHLNPEIEKLYEGLREYGSSDSAMRRIFSPLGVINMLNTKYVLVGTRSGKEPVVLTNPEANGPAWFIKELRDVPTADSEIVLLGRISTKEEAVIRKKFADKLKTKRWEHPEENKIHLKRYISNLALYEADVKQEGFVVFSEIYYPDGWNVYLDGKPAEYYPVNYVLRGMIVPAGKHTIEFRFEPRTYEISNRIALAGSLLLFASGIALLYLILKEKNLKNPS